MSLEQSVQLLREFEAAHGTLRLDLRPAVPDRDDPAAAAYVKRVFGVSASLGTLDMFESTLLGSLRSSALHVLGSQAAAFDSIAFGWSSAPILNACTIRRDDATAIVVNIRLSTFLTAINALTWKLEQALLEHDRALTQRCRDSIRALLTAAREPEMGQALKESVDTIVDPDALTLGIVLKEVQLLFVLLHEIGHVVCGHLDQESGWKEHPLSSDSFSAFAGSIRTEYEADRFAFARLLPPSSWRIFASRLAGFDAPIPDRTRVILVGHLFVWFHLLVRRAQETYYQVPRSHPHPLDRLDRYLDAIKELVPSLAAFPFREVFQSTLTLCK
jgi:hypothetical protein